MSDGDVVFECVVCADLFSRAHMGVSKEETRYYLNGVHVSPGPEGGAVITATDGSMLISLFDPDAKITGDAIVQLSKEMVRALPVSGALLEKRLLVVRVAKGGKGRAFVVDQPTRSVGNDEFSPYEAALEVLDDPDKRVRAAQFGAVNIDGNFPNWRHVLPTELRPDAPFPTVNMDKMAIIAKALCNKRDAQLSITPSGVDPANSPVLITPYSRHLRQAFAILMPLRNERRTDAVPPWALAPELPKAA